MNKYLLCLIAIYVIGWIGFTIGFLVLCNDARPKSVTLWNYVPRSILFSLIWPYFLYGYIAFWVIPEIKEKNEERKIKIV